MRRLQTNQKKKEQQKKNIITAVLALAAILALLFGLGVFGGGRRAMNAYKLRCVATQQITPFGSDVLYYDGMTLFCLNSKGGERWFYTLGENAAFSCSDNGIVAWTGTQLHILDRNGHSSYNENLSDVIQFARIGSRYVAAVLGSNKSPSLIVKDMQGTTVDQETAGYVDKIILDLDFFGNGDYLWTTSMDVYGTTPDTILNTFRVNMTSSGEISLGDHLPYAIIYAGDELNVISTQHLRQYDYRGTQDTTGTTLVYGWQLIDDYVSGNTANLLFAPTRQIENVFSINQVRYISGKTDKRFTLPSSCIGALVYRNKIYAIASDAMYRADVNANRFSTISLPENLQASAITSYLGMLDNGMALVACDNDVYTIALP